MPSITSGPGSPGPIARDMLFDLMVLARDTSFPDAQIRAVCDTVTQENVGGSVELLRPLHASQDTSLVLAAPPSPVQSVVSFRSKPQARSFTNASSEAGATLCAETFYKLCKDDRLKLQRLSTFCPFTLAFQRCPHSDRCQLVHICWEVQCKRGSTCMYSHQLIATCDSVLNGTRCSRTRRLVGDNKKRACPRNHDYKVRIFMGAMRVPHELGFYGLSEARAQVHITPSIGPGIPPLNKPATTPPIEPDITADWMMSDAEDQLSVHENVEAVAEVEECDVRDGGRVQTPEADTLPDIDLIMFS